MTPPRPAITAMPGATCGTLRGGYLDEVERPFDFAKISPPEAADVRHPRRGRP